MFNLLAHVSDPINPIIVEFGDFTITKYSVMILLGILIAYVLGYIEGNKLGFTKTDQDNVFNGMIIIVAISIIGARLYYVAFQWDNYKNDLIEILYINHGGLAIHGGIIAAFVSAIVYCKIVKLDIWKIFDLMAPGFLIAQVSGRWGNFFNQEAHGGVIGGIDSEGHALLTWDEQRSFLSSKLHLPDFITDQMFINDIATSFNYYHPTFLYEGLWNLLGFVLILVLRRTKLTRKGDFLFLYLCWYAVGRFFIEAMRTDALFIGNTGLRTAQVISIFMLIGGVVGVLINHLVLKNNFYYDCLVNGSDTVSKDELTEEV